MLYSDDSKYIAELAETIRELAVSKNEIAQYIGVSDKTVSRYFAEESRIKDKNKEKIQQLIEERSHYGEYQHKPAKVFANLFNALFNEFQDEITQEEFAELAGFSGQSQISKISSGEKQLSSEEQYNILSAFLRLCTNQNAYNCRGFDAENVFSRHYDTARSLYLTLYGNTESFDMFERYRENEFSNFVIKLTLINYFVTLPYNAQELILNSPSAFFDSLQILYFDSFIECPRVGGNALYPSVSEFMDRFNDMPHHTRKVFQKELEVLAAEKKVFSYYDHSDNWQLFDITTQYRRMIKSARDRRIADTTETLVYIGERIDGYKPIYGYSIDDLKDETKDSCFDRDKQVKRFEAVIHDLIDFDRTQYTVDELTDLIIDDIEYRLTMCPYEWHMWMLYASYVFAYQEDDTIYELMDRILESDADDVNDVW